MPTFDYQAYDRSGRARSGTASADSDRLLRRRLREQGLYVTAIDPVERGPLAPRMVLRLPALQRPLNQGELALILRQLGTLLSSGLPLAEALALMAEQGETRRQARAVESWRSQIVEGLSFARALERSVYRVPESLVAAVAIAEETGHLARVVVRLADEQEVAAENRRQLLKGMIYPAVMAAVAVGVIGAMLTWVVPQVTRVFINTRTELPLLTRSMIAVSEFLQHWGPLILALLGLVAIGFWLASRKASFRLERDRRIAALPLVGGWVRMANFGDWSRSLGLLLGSGVPALSALRIASTSLHNSWYRQRMESVIERVRGGSSLHQALRDGNFAPPFVLHMVGSGEASSELDSMLLRVADYYRNRLHHSIDTAMKLMEPALIVTMGIVVMLIVGAVLVPIVRMNQLI